MIQEVRVAVRTLVRDPGFAGASIVTLGCGIGLAVAMFTVFEAVLRRPLPMREQERVVVLWGESPGSVRRLPLTYEHFKRFREEARTLEEVAGALNAGAAPHAVRDVHRTSTLNVGAVTGNFFRVLGSSPVVGRMLQPDDDVTGAAPVMVISHGLWRRYFGGDRGVIGRRLTLVQREVTYTVVGVAPPGLEFPTGADLWVPLVPFSTLEVVPLGRLAPTATPALAAAELRASFRRDASGPRREVTAAAEPLPELIVGDVRPAVLVLSAAAALLLLVACLNVTNLLLVRASGRSHEIAVRRALGAERHRIMRQLLTESVVLGLGGGLLGAGLAVALVQGLLAIAPPELPRLEEIHLMGVPLVIAAGVTVAAVLVFGLVPAIWTSDNVAGQLRTGDRSSTESKSRRRAQHALVVLQVGIAIVVLGTAGLLARSLRNLERLDVGFSGDRVAILHLGWPHEKFNSPDKVSALHDVLIAHIGALPDVESVASVNVAPFTGATGGWDGWFVVEGRSAANPATTPVFSMGVVGAEYFRTFGIQLLRGRGFTDADRAGSPRVVVVSDAVGRVLWPGEDPLGKRIGLGRPTRAEDWWTVVGVAPETHYRTLREPAPTVYLPYRQFAHEVTTLAVRTAREPAAAVASIRDTIRRTDPDVTVVQADTMEGLVANQLAQPRLSALLLGVFGAGALLLAAVGLYAVLSYVVRRRTRELAIRHALGALPSRLRSLVITQALGLAGLGILIGLAASVAGGGLLQSLLFGVSPADPLTLTAAAAVLLGVTVAASWLPAQRAMRADPVTVLREE